MVDPGDAEPVMDYLQHHGLRLAAILITHHHGDHSGGVEELQQHFDCPVYGPRRKTIASDHRIRSAKAIWSTLPELGMRHSRSSTYPATPPATSPIMG